VSAALPPGSPDLLLPTPASTPDPVTPDPDEEEAKHNLLAQPPYILDVQLGSILMRLRSIAPPPAMSDAARQLPLPALTSFRAAMHMRQRRAREQAESDRAGRGSTRLPGGLDTVDE
jgi:hypothetical protein